jgi:hypothetical protein
MHHYHSWSNKCTGTIDGQDSGYACGDAENRDKVLDKCTGWASEFRKIVNKECGGVDT